VHLQAYAATPDIFTMSSSPMSIANLLTPRALAMATSYKDQWVLQRSSEHNLIVRRIFRSGAVTEAQDERSGSESSGRLSHRQVDPYPRTRTARSGPFPHPSQRRRPGA
jgi:hypothetical protein